MKSIIGRKIGMTQAFNEDGKVIPVTLVEIEGDTDFQAGDKVKVTGTSKGKGFQGVVKRHGFHGMPASHGHFSVVRHGGSIGQRFPQHTLKGMRMPGRMGGVKSSVRGLTIIKVDPEAKILAIKGAIPGNRGSKVKILQK